MVEKMKEKLRENTKFYILNLFYYFLIFSAFTVVFGTSASPGGKFSLSRGYSASSFLAVIYLGHKIAMEFVKGSKKPSKRLN